MVFDWGLTKSTHCIVPNESREVDGVQHGPGYQHTLGVFKVIPVVPTVLTNGNICNVIFIVPIVPLVKTVGIIIRRLKARSVLYTVRVGQSRVFDRG